MYIHLPFNLYFFPLFNCVGWHLFTSVKKIYVERKLYHCIASDINEGFSIINLLNSYYEFIISHKYSYILA